MTTITAFQNAKNYQHSISKTGVAAAFFAWCNSQEKNRLIWLGVSLTVHTCFLTPITFLCVILAGASSLLLALTSISIMLSLVVNLAAQPTRLTIPIFMFSLLLNIGVIIAAMTTGLDFTKAF